MCFYNITYGITELYYFENMYDIIPEFVTII